MTNWVLVTGGAKRLGRELCLAFADAGWSVVCHYRTSDEEARQTQALVQARGQVCHTLAWDLTAPNAPADIMAACVRLCGAVPRSIINNASIFEQDLGENATAQSLQAHFQANTAVPLLLAKELRLAAQRGAGWHSVVHVLDQKVHNLNPDYFSYTVSKLALERSVALQAQALAPWVRVCGLSPGLLYLSGPQTPANFAQVSALNLTQQAINASDVATAAVFLASNSSITGSTLQTDNGQHLMAQRRDVMYLTPGSTEP